MLRTAAYHYELSFAWWYDSKNSKQINLTLNASIADHLNVASFHLLFLVQQTICELIKDMFVVRQLKIWKGDASCKGRPHVENKLFTVVLNVGVFMNSDGQKSWRSHDFLFVPTEPTIYTKKSGAVLLRTISSGQISEATSVTWTNMTRGRGHSQ